MSLPRPCPPKALRRRALKNNMKILFWIIVIALGACIPFVPAYNITLTIPLWIIVVAIGAFGFIKTLL